MLDESKTEENRYSLVGERKGAEGRRGIKGPGLRIERRRRRIEERGKVGVRCDPGKMAKTRRYEPEMLRGM